MIIISCPYFYFEPRYISYGETNFNAKVIILIVSHQCEWSIEALLSYNAMSFFSRLDFWNRLYSWIRNYSIESTNTISCPQTIFKFCSSLRQVTHDNRAYYFIEIDGLILILYTRLIIFEHWEFSCKNNSKKKISSLYREQLYIYVKLHGNSLILPRKKRFRPNN